MGRSAWFALLVMFLTLFTSCRSRLNENDYDAWVVSSTFLDPSGLWSKCRDLSMIRSYTGSERQKREVGRGLAIRIGGDGTCALEIFKDADTPEKPEYFTPRLGRADRNGHIWAGPDEGPVFRGAAEAYRSDRRVVA